MAYRRYIAPVHRFLAVLERIISMRFRAPRTTSEKARQTRHYARFLSQSIVLDEAAPPQIASITIAIICGFVLSFIVWSTVARFNETATAEGHVIPAARVQPVQHLEGGIVGQLLVREGDLVRQNDILIRLRDNAAAAELARARAQHAALALEAERLRAFALERSVNFPATSAALSSLARDQAQILAVQNASRESQRNIIHAQIGERRQQVTRFDDQIAMFERNVALYEKELGMLEKLVAKGLTSKMRHIATQRELNEARGALVEAMSARTSAVSALTEAENRLIELNERLRNEALDQMGSVSIELAQVREDINRLEDRVARLEIRAPARGTVKGLTVNGIGRVVAPGEVVMEIVPVDHDLLAEVRISPRDVGHLDIGKEALVKLTSYDFARFGGISGTLTNISASSFKDEEGSRYFKGTIQLASAHIGPDPRSNRITPGMTLIADITTGDKTLMQYLIRPVYNAISGSFGER